MEEELQAAEDAEQPEVSESAPDKGENPDKKIEFTDEQKRYFEEVVGKKAFKAREAEREAARLREELEKVKAQAPKETRPDIPDKPDPYEDGFEERLQARDEAIRKAAEFDAQERFRQEQEERQKTEAEQRAQNERQQVIQDYAQRALKLGVTEQELYKAGTTVTNYGIDEQIEDFILQSDQGPLITVFLEQNLLELDKVRQMDPLSAAVYIETSLKPKAAALKTQVTNAPDPAETLTGAGVTSYEGPKGATYE